MFLAKTRIQPTLALAVARILPFVAVSAFLAQPARTEAGDITAFATLPRPGDTWARGYGAALSSTWFQVATFEGEAARLPGESEDEGMTTFTASAMLAPPVGLLTPYGGLGVGLFRQTLGAKSDTGTLKAYMVGVKLKVGGLLVLKGEFRKIELSGTPLLPMTSRFSLGAGISF